MEHVLLQGMHVQMARHSQCVPCHMIGLHTCDAKTSRYATGHETGHETGTPGTGHETAPLKQALETAYETAHETRSLNPTHETAMKPGMKPPS